MSLLSSARDFELEDLIVITAMTGTEWADTVRDFEAYVLPQFRTMASALFRSL